jgi:GrpB-like predicted nucleotidyltransferase (UPF0157 family)
MVRLVDHRAEWAQEFGAEASRIGACLDARAVVVEHIGSTAIPGLLAKAVIDIAVRTASGVDPLALAPDLASIGYAQHLGGPMNHGVYVRSTNGERTQILHAFANHVWEHCHQRLFRDRLLRDPQARQRYAELKQSLADQHSEGREYTAAKRGLVEELVNDERARLGLPSVAVWDK